MNSMKNDIEKIIVEQVQDNIRVIEIDDPYEYVTSNKVIAYMRIGTRNGQQKRKLIRTKNGGYMMQ